MGRKKTVLGALCVYAVIFVSSLVLLTACAGPFANSSQIGTSSRDIVDSPPTLPRMTGVNWFGFETGLYVPHGLWARDYRSMLQQIKDLGFNTIRIPFSDEMLDKTPSAGLQINAYGSDPYTGISGINVGLTGLSSLQILDTIIDYAGSLGLRIVLDNHSREADGYYNQTLWYTDKVSEATWIDDWVMLAKRYKDKTNVVAFDLSNEPHGGYLVPGMTPAATWGFDLPGVAGPTNWKAAAERCAAAIMAVNSNIIFIIQGVQDYEGTNYWWGSNLRGIKIDPITSIPKNRLMYSVHEYGPEVHSQDWFTDPAFPANLPAVWRDAFYFVYEQNLAGLYIGEIGIKEESAGQPDSIPYKWYTSFLQFAGKKVHFTYWSWNPDSGDTGGILKDDWLTVNPLKYGLLKPYLEPNSSTPSASPSIVPTVQPSVTPSVQPSPEQSATPSVVPSLLPSPTPITSASPAPTGLTQLTMEYASTGTQTQTNTIGLKLRLTSFGGGMSLSNMKIRYYYSSEASSQNSAVCDYAGAQLNGTYLALTGKIMPLVAQISPAKAGADHYLECGFSTDSPILSANESVEIQLRIVNQAWSLFDQTDDYSFIPAAVSYTANPKIVVLQHDLIVSGVAP